MEISRHPLGHHTNPSCAGCKNFPTVFYRNAANRIHRNGYAVCDLTQKCKPPRWHSFFTVCGKNVPCNGVTSPHALCLLCFPGAVYRDTPDRWKGCPGNLPELRHGKMQGRMQPLGNFRVGMDQQRDVIGVGDTLTFVCQPPILGLGKVFFPQEDGAFVH